MIMMTVLRLFSFPAPEQGCFSWGGISVDSWTPGRKPLCHRHPTGPHPSGLLWTPWTPAKGSSTKSNFALDRVSCLLEGVEQRQGLGVGERQDLRGIDAADALLLVDPVVGVGEAGPGEAAGRAAGRRRRGGDH